MFPTTLDVLPDDVLYDVLHHSSVRDILCLRQVSRKFYHLTHHRPVWVNAYTRCPILLPPGPFSYQSSADLELVLKKSHLLEANWTSPSPCPISRQTFEDTSVGPWSPGLSCMKLVSGRYLLIAGQPMLRCYDLESTNEEFAAIAVYDTVETNFDCAVEKDSAVDSTECQLICALMNQPRVNERIAAVTLLRLRISRGSAKFELMKEVPVPRKPFYRDTKITGDFVAVGTWSHGPLLLHIPTYQVYDVPLCDFSEVEGMATGLRSEYILTSHHLFCFSELGFEKILEVFPLPHGDAQPNDDNETRILTRSHKCNHNQHIEWAILLTERHDLHNNNDPSAIDHWHYTFVAVKVNRSRWRPAGRSDGMGFLDISLMPDLGTTTWTDAAEFEGEYSHGEQINMFTGSSRAGVSRLIGRTTFRELIAITVSEDGDGNRVVRGKPIVLEEPRKIPIAFDGVHGRMCRLVSPAQIEVVSFA